MSRVSSHYREGIAKQLGTLSFFASLASNLIYSLHERRGTDTLVSQRRLELFCMRLCPRQL